MRRNSVVLFGVATPKEMKDEGNSLTYNSFSVERTLGIGFNSEIVRAKHKVSGKRVAIKSYHKKKIDKMQTEQILRECRIHLKIFHPHILTLYAVIEDDNAFHFVTELAERGDLFTYLRKQPGQRLNEADATKMVLFPFISALSWLHERGIAHRDIKPENILLDANLRLMICDFGLAIDTTRERPLTRLGTLEYMSPEVLLASDKLTREEREKKSKTFYTAAADVWSTGVLAMEILTGSSPFARKNNDDTALAILRRDVRFPPHLSPEAIGFIEAALQTRSEERPRLADLLATPLIRRYTRSLQHSHSGLPSGSSRNSGALSEDEDRRRTGNTCESSNGVGLATPTDLMKQIHQRRVQVQAQQTVSVRKLEVAPAAAGTPLDGPLEFATVGEALDHHQLPNNRHVTEDDAFATPVRKAAGVSLQSTASRHVLLQDAPLSKSEKQPAVPKAALAVRKAHSSTPGTPGLARNPISRSPSTEAGLAGATGVVLQVNQAAEGAGDASVIDLYRHQTGRALEAHSRNQIAFVGPLSSAASRPLVSTRSDASTMEEAMDAHAEGKDAPFRSVPPSPSASASDPLPQSPGLLRRLFSKMSIKS